MNSPSFARAISARRFASLSVVAAGTVLLALGLLATQRDARASASPYDIVRADTRQSVAGHIARTNSGGTPSAVITQKEKVFLPATIELRVGQTVEIVNDDTTMHNAYCAAGDFKYNSGPQQPGTKSTLTFTAAGSYEVRCAIHPKMRLAVVVSP